jgi:tetratricopeptide (TPR) repeat protein
LAGHNRLELEIHNLFQEGHPLDVICSEVLAKYEKSDVISPFEAESISHFLLSAGRIDLLFKFYLKGLRKNSLGAFPWGHFAEAVKKMEVELPDLVISLIEMGLEAQPDEASAFKSPSVVAAIPKLNNRIQDLRKNYELEKLQLKSKLMTQLNHNRLYQQSEQEEQTLHQLIKIFPTDIDVKLLHQAHLEKKADEILARVKRPMGLPPTGARRLFEDDHPEAQEFTGELKRVLYLLSDKLQTEAPDQIYNLAVLAMQFELYDISLELIDAAPRTTASEWLKAEMLFESGRYLELLKHIENIETHANQTAEATYGGIYLKAQAYFGLGQRDIAIRLLESLSDKAPNYRSTQALLHEWKTS